MTSTNYDLPGFIYIYGYIFIYGYIYKLAAKILKNSAKLKLVQLKLLV